MKVWAVANQKGGVGKTTTAVTLGGTCASRGENTLLVDLDPHGSLTAYFGYDPDTIQSSSYDLFQSESVTEESVRSLLRQTSVDHLHVLPASVALATLDRQLGTRSGMGLAVANAVKTIANDFEYVLLDCPPMMGVLMVNALAACDHLIVPVQTEFLAIKGMERMLHSLQMIERAKQLHIPFTILPTMFDRRTRASNDSLQLLNDKFGENLWESLIPIDTRFREASANGKPLSHYQASSRGAKAYRELLDYLLEGLQEPEHRMAL